MSWSRARCASVGLSAACLPADRQGPGGAAAVHAGGHQGGHPRALLRQGHLAVHGVPGARRGSRVWPGGRRVRSEQLVRARAQCRQLCCLAAPAASVAASIGGGRLRSGGRLISRPRMRLHGACARPAAPRSTLRRTARGPGRCGRCTGWRRARCSGRSSWSATTGAAPPLDSTRVRSGWQAARAAGRLTSSLCVACAAFACPGGVLRPRPGAARVRSGHQSFSSNKALNDFVGNVVHSSILVPYHGWRVSHRTHHGNHGHVENDESWHPVSKGIYDGMARPACMLLHMDRHLPGMLSCRAHRPLAAAPGTVLCQASAACPPLRRHPHPVVCRSALRWRGAVQGYGRPETRAACVARRARRSPWRGWGGCRSRRRCSRTRSTSGSAARARRARTLTLPATCSRRASATWCGAPLGL